MKNRNSNVVLLTELAVLVAIIIIMAFTPLGYLRVGAISITFIVVPVAIGSVVLGPKAGAVLGLVFGLTSFSQCFGMSAIGTLMLNANPIGTAFVCIVPRIIVGIVPGLVYKGLRKVFKKRGVAVAIGCLLGPVTNTILYLGAMVLIFKDLAAEAFGYTAGGSALAFFGWLIVLVAVNAVLEAASCLVAGTAVCNALFHVVNKE